MKHNLHQNFINLTNGIEILELVKDLDLISFIRIQSTICEQKDWNRLIMDLDNNFLMKVALGYQCHIYDYTHHGKESRAIWQGVEFIKYCLNQLWFQTEGGVNPNFRNYFHEEYVRLSQTVWNKIKYYRKFLFINELDNIICHCDKTNLDGKYEEYRKILEEVYF